MTRTQTIAGGAVFGALSIAVSLLHLGVPFLPVPYLVFQFAEIPVVISGFLFGPVGALISAAEYWAMLQILGQFAPVGPATAFLGVGSSLLGVFVAGFLFDRAGKKAGLWTFTAAAVLVGALVRVPLETFVNYEILLYVAPGFAPLALKLLGAFLGYQLPAGSGLDLVLAFTALFNGIQTVVSVVPSAAVSAVAVSRQASRHGSWYWMTAHVRFEKKERPPLPSPS